MSSDLEGVFDAIPPGHGAVGLLSSDEFKPVVEPFDRALLEATGPRIGLVLAADARAAPHSARLGLAHYRRLGAEPSVVEVLRREDATAGALPDLDVLFLAGGSPASLITALRDTPFWDEALARWREGMALAGSSAGAMALCRNSLVPQRGDRRPTQWEKGLGPIERVALAVHAATAPESWLAHVKETAPVPAVALDDAVGVLLRPGARPTVAGNGDVRVL